MSALAAPNRSLFDPTIPTPARVEAPHRASRTIRIWREVPAPRDEPEQALIVERIEEDCERWDGLS